MLKEKEKKEEGKKEKRENRGGFLSLNGLCVLPPFLSVFLGEKLGGELG